MFPLRHPGRRRARRLASAVCASLLAFSLGLAAQAPARQKGRPAAKAAAAPAPHLTSPQEFFGFNIGDDYQLPNYTRSAEYWQKLATESDRMKLVNMGQTEMGKTQWMVILSSPENLKNLDRYKEINQRLARAENLTDDQARQLAAEGKTVVWIDGGLHSDETVGFSQLVENIWELASKTDPETMRLLNDDIILCVPVNPDGSELVANWYMRNPDPKARSSAGLPQLYNKYVGHDDNRDSYMSNMLETQNANRQLYMEWFPELLYNHHQTGPAGGVIFMPPFRDPFNYNFDPLIPLQIETVGSLMHSRLVERGMGGSEMRSGSSYSTWWDGGVRTTAYFHNIIGILTEIIGEPTPMNIPFVAAKQLPTGDWPMPVTPGVWHYQQSIDYSMQTDRAMLDYASRYGETLRFNIYEMGRNSIQRGSEDWWTITPKSIADLDAAVAERNAAATGGSTGAAAGGGRGARGGGAFGGGGGGRGRGGLSMDDYNNIFHAADKRDARAYILTADQPDFATATYFINVLIKNGTEVWKADSPFSVAGKHYPAGSWVVKTAQADRPFVLDMFEPQHHPNDFQYPGGPPIPPYDIAGWTVAYQMGVQFDRVLDGFDAPLTEMPFGKVQPMPSEPVTGSASAGYLIDHRINNSFILTNRLLKANCDVYWLEAPQSADGEALPAGTLWVPATAASTPLVEAAARDLGVGAHGVAAAPGGAAWKLKPIRIGLYDQYGGSMPSGWLRWTLEQFEFPFQVVYPPDLDRGDLKSKFDALIFVDGGSVGGGGRGGRGGGGRGGRGAVVLSGEWAMYNGRQGSMTAQTTLPALEQFVKEGGTVLTIGSGTGLARSLGAPLADYLTEMGPNGTPVPLPRDKFYIPGSLMRLNVDNTQPLAYGMPDSVDAFFDSSPVFRIEPGGPQTSPVAWFKGTNTLESGWAWGQQYLDGGIAITSSPIGAGKVVAIGPEVTFRAQPHGTYKFVFNGVYYGTATETQLH